MRLWALPIPALSLVACTSTTPLTNEPLDRCESTDCFNQAQIRNYEVVDNTTLVVYVGNQNCAFRVEFTGTFCDLTFMPGGDLVFRPDTFRAQRETDVLLTRVCAHDSNVGIDEGPFSTAAGGDEFAERRIPCRVQNIVSLTDDELLELYVDKQITPPPPPFGTGELEVPERSAAEPGTEEGAEEAPPGAAPDESSASGSAGPTAAN